MSASFKRRFLIWGYNVFNAFFYGVVGGTATLLGAESVNVFIQTDTIKHFSFHQFIAVCLVSGAIAAINYVRTPQGRLPSLDTEPGTIELPK